MALRRNKIFSEDADPNIEKTVSSLMEPAKRAKQALQNALEKSVKRFQDQAEKSASKHEKSLFLRKAEKKAKDLDVLKVLTEGEVIRYALLMIDKIMPIASNPRMPREERMKARVASHKPLHTRLFRLRRKLSESNEAPSESEAEDDKSSSTLDKVTFNNAIVLMRKDVRRAKVHVIHKLTRTIKKLKTAKGKEEKIKKFKRKAERLHKKVIHIKELHEDEISKFALSTTQNLSQLAIDVKAPSTSQALATIAIHEFVAAHVTDFKTKYPDWEKVIPNLLKKKSKKRKITLEVKENIPNSGKVSKASTESENDQSESENDQLESENNQSESEKDSSESENGDGCEKDHLESDSEDGGDSSENGEEEVNPTIIDKKASQDENEEETIGFLEDQVTISKKNKINSVKQIIKENSKTTKIPSNDLKVKGNSSTNKKIIKRDERMIETFPHVSAKPVEDKPKVVDPFFVTTTNEEYVTTQVPLSSETNFSSDAMDRFKSHQSGKTSKFDYKNKWERTGSEGKFGKFNRFIDSAPYKKQDSGSFNNISGIIKSDKIIFGNRKERRKALQQPQVEEKVEKLHPSWEAKKKQASIIPFQGKKVTFD